MFPIRAARRNEHTPYMTYMLIAVNVVIFLWQTTLSEAQLSQLYMTAGFIPCKVSANFFAPDSFFSGITSMFLHGGWLHLLGNMLFLYTFGPAVEDYLGKRLYLLFYIGAGLSGSLMHMLFSSGVCVPAIGASGAILGLMGGFLLLYPATRIVTVVLLWRFPVGIQRIAAFYVLLSYFVLDLINGIASLGPETAATEGVAFWAHVGGFLAGFVMSFIIMTFKPLPPVDPFAYLDEE